MGLTLTGGGALLKNIDKRFSKETGLPVHIADEPLSCVAIGTGRNFKSRTNILYYVDRILIKMASSRDDFIIAINLLLKKHSTKFFC